MSEVCDAYAIGIDIGGTNTKLGIVTEQGKLVCETRCPTPSSELGPVDIAYLSPKINKLLSEAGLSLCRVVSVGIGLPMLFDGYGNITKCFNVCMKNDAMWQSLKQMFDDMPLALINDTNAAVLGESWKGALQKHDSAVMLTLGTGVGGGIICEGELVVGAHGAAGEFGHMKVNENEKETCACGRRGCLEQYVSARGVVHQAQLALKDNPTSTLLVSDLSASKVFEAFQEGDEVAVRVVESFAHDLALAIARLAVVDDPEVFVIGGGLVHYADCYIDMVREMYQDEAFPACRETPIIIAELGNKAGVFGAAYEALRIQ